jgi:hypothetical protein
MCSKKLILLIFPHTLAKEIVMKKTIIFLTIAALLIVVSPAIAARSLPTSPKINILYGVDIDFPANSAFHIAHGWSIDLATESRAVLARADFELQIDGVYVAEDFVTRDASVPGSVAKYFVFDYPGGMTGTHEFTGHWYLQCKHSGEVCVDKNAMVEIYTNTITVTFTP